MFYRVGLDVSEKDEPLAPAGIRDVSQRSAVRDFTLRTKFH